MPTLRIESPPNYNLKWERTAVTNLGLDFAFFNNRISGAVDWYYKKSTDVLSNFPINPTLGFSSVLINEGTIENKGLEVQLRGKIIRSNNFEWESNILYSLNKNKVLKVTVPSNVLLAFFLSQGFPVEGYPYGALFASRFGGLNPITGAMQFLYKDGSIVDDLGGFALGPNISEAKYIGSSRPVWNGAWGNTITYKNLQLHFLFVFYGNYFQRRLFQTSVENGITANRNNLKEQWLKPGDETTAIFPSSNVTSFNDFDGLNYLAKYADIFTYSANYAKLREVNLTYSLSNKWIDKLNGVIKSVQLRAQGRNLLLITKNKLGIDPEIGSSGAPLLCLLIHSQPTLLFKEHLKCKLICLIK